MTNTQGLTSPNSDRDPIAWVRDTQPVEARLSDGTEFASGHVVGHYDRPTVIIEMADGDQLAWLVDLTHPVAEAAAVRDDSNPTTDATADLIDPIAAALSLLDRFHTPGDRGRTLALISDLRQILANA